MDEAEEDVLGADVRVVQEACFLLRQHDDPAGPVSEPFEHKYRLCGAVDTCAQCTGGFGLQLAGRARTMGRPSQGARLPTPPRRLRTLGNPWPTPPRRCWRPPRSP